MVCVTLLEFQILDFISMVRLLSLVPNTRGAMILRLLGNETIHFVTRVKKTKPGFRKQLKIDIKSVTKFYFSLNIRTYSYSFLIQGVFIFTFIIFKYLQILNVCNDVFIRRHSNITYFEDASNLAI